MAFATDQINDDGFVIPDWPAPANVCAIATTRLIAGASRAPFDHFNLGARSGDDIADVAANRAALIRKLQLPSAPLWLQQVHGVEVIDADTCSGNAGFDADAEPIADSAIARRVNVALAVMTADCLPVLVCADDGSAVGIAHAGWRGLAGGVIEATIAAMSTSPDGMPADRMLAWLGPAIGAASYEVGAEVRAAFVDRDHDAQSAFVPTRAGHWRCDLSALARMRLRQLGITRVFGGGFDTCADARFYSYRRDGRTGRFASLIWMTPSRA